jgi:hypothetical protein
VLARKTGAGALRRPVLVALGLRPDGKKEIIDFRLAASESAAEWEKFLADLYRRGLTGEGLHMICVDGGSGLLAALPSVLHGIPVQRCWAHKFRNVLDKVRKADQPKVKRALHKIMNAAIRRKRPTAAMPCLPRDRKEIWTDLRWAVAGVSVGPEQSPGVSAGGFSFGAARSGLPVSLQLDCPSPLRNALSFVSPNFQPCARGASGDGGVSLNSRGSQSTIRPSRSYGGRSPDADGGGR